MEIRVTRQRLTEYESRLMAAAIAPNKHVAPHLCLVHRSDITKALALIERLNKRLDKEKRKSP
jgi:hypothetical protein